MGVLDVVLAAAILGAAVYVLYRRIWKSGGHCGGCSGSCQVPRGEGSCAQAGRAAAEVNE
ncbi:MAG TPA: hypothetical protein VEB43_20285 [Anaeromyxobacter sp.]|nr:hypothetical protein [Anaeromyxobacter sp.]